MKSRFIVLMVLVFVAALFSGCASTGDLDKLKMQVQDLSAKVDQTQMKADQAAARAEAAAKLAEDNAKKAEAIFMKSMKK